MQSLCELYKIGRGPSSSHTMGPERAIKTLKERFPKADLFKVTLYGSLALTGEGHGTDTVLKKTASPAKCEVTWDTVTPCPVHPNTMDVEIYKGEELLEKKRVYSVGGGSIVFDGEEKPYVKDDVYPHKTYTEISDYCKAHKLRLWEYVKEFEGEGVFDYLLTVWERMKRTIHKGLTTSGTLPGILGTKRRAQKLYNQRHIDESAQTRENRLVCSYAFATSEQNASGGIIVTAPTCGACGVVPSVLKYMQETRGFTDTQVVHALAAGGIIGNIIKTNASISGAECGCQAEIGSACSMAAAALAELFEMGLKQIEYAAEVAMEHHLGLTCDPIAGLVQIPCIERNAYAAARALDANIYASFSDGEHRVSFDKLVTVMKETGHDLPSLYKETGEGGLAKGSLQ